MSIMLQTFSSNNLTYIQQIVHSQKIFKYKQITIDSTSSFSLFLKITLFKLKNVLDCWKSFFSQGYKYLLKIILKTINRIPVELFTRWHTQANCWNSSALCNSSANIREIFSTMKFIKDAWLIFDTHLHKNVQCLIKWRKNHNIDLVIFFTLQRPILLIFLCLLHQILFHLFVDFSIK